MYRQQQAQKGRGGSGRGCDHRNQAGANGVADIDAEEQRRHRGDDDASAKTRQRAQESGGAAGQSNRRAEFERVQMAPRPR